MTRLVVSSLGLAFFLTGCQGNTTCICTPVDDFTRTVTITTDTSCETVAASESNIYSSCIESSASVSPFGPTIALRVLSDPVWQTPWPHNGSALSRPFGVAMAAR